MAVVTWPEYLRSCWLGHLKAYIGTNYADHVGGSTLFRVFHGSRSVDSNLQSLDYTLRKRVKCFKYNNE